VPNSTLSLLASPLSFCDAMLSEFIAHNYDDIVLRCRERAPNATADVDHRLILDQLAAALQSGHRAGLSSIRIPSTRGLTVSQILEDYYDVRNAVATLALERDEALTVGECVTLDRCLDDAVVRVITEFSRKSRVLSAA
jgi:hypothetical protein